MSKLGFGNNIASLQAQRRLSEASSALAKSFERLSSGLRINEASDDAAGLSISSSLSASARIFSQAIRNVNDGISATSIAEGALTQLRDLSVRQRELATEAANGSYSHTQRRALDREANALVDEWNRIVSTTTFNGLNLFGSNSAGVTIQEGTGNQNTLFIDLGQSLSRAAGDGTFGAKITTPDNVYTTAAADFNGDGKLDLLIGGGQIELGQGDGTFSFSTDLGEGTSKHFAIADFNGDGIADIVTQGSSPALKVFTGNGDGTFRESTIGPGLSFTGVVAADLNGDGITDIAAADYYNGSVHVLLGNGDGTFKAEHSFATSMADSVRAADVNDDGKIDLITAGRSGNLNVLLGTGSGAFGAATQIAASVDSIETVDINQDGYVDIVGNSYAGGTHQILSFIGNGNGTFSGARTIYAGGAATINDMHIADFNNDGRADLALVSANSFFTTLLGGGDGTFAVSSSTSGVLKSITIGDFNGDGRQDVNVQDYLPGQGGTYLGTGARVTTSEYLNLNSRRTALSAMTTIDGNLSRISTELSHIGAAQSRMGITLQTLAAARENFLAAASRIQDVDVAQESAELVRRQIQSQAAAAVLSQANQTPALALKLLTG